MLTLKRYKGGLCFDSRCTFFVYDGLECFKYEKFNYFRALSRILLLWLKGFELILAITHNRTFMSTHTKTNSQSQAIDTLHADVVVVGSGAAGLTAALRLPQHLDILILSKSDITEASTYYAQGGIAAVVDKTDSIEAHVADTLTCGDGLCHPGIVRNIVTQGPAIIKWLESLNVPFSRQKAAPLEGLNDQSLASLHLTQEGGHSHRRIIHAADSTGLAVWQQLASTVAKRNNIRLLANATAVDIIINADNQQAQGLYVFNQTTDQVDTVSARAIILATGGANKTYLYTSNPDVATGDGIAMAWRAGCRVANMEFMQFHPTCLFHPQMRSFLISEAVRGEGGLLKLPNGERFMDKYHPRAELAQRDIVARAIDTEMKRHGLECVYLDISHLDQAFIKSHFPMIYQKCLSIGLDISQEPIPVVPAAHYTCGGVVTDQAGQTDVAGLYAIGETACTGLHGANRMASNSLLECFACAFSAAQVIADTIQATPAPGNLKPWDDSQVMDSEEDITITHNWLELRRFMWNYVGIVRSDARLARAERRINLLKQEVLEYYSHYHVTNNLLELRNLLTIAELIVKCAQLRKESRGLHSTTDYPQLNQLLADSILTPSNSSGSYVRFNINDTME